LVPTPDGLKLAEYKLRMQRLTHFIETYPSSSKVRDVMDLRVELRDEMRLVEEGAVKIDGVLYPANELRENAYELDGRVESRKIKLLVAGGQHLQALRDYTMFSQDYKHTKANQALIPIIEQVMRTHAAKATEWNDSLSRRLEEREKGLESMTPSDRRDSERAIEEQKLQLERLYRTEVSSRVGWVTIHPYSKQSLDSAIQSYKQQVRELELFMTNGFVDGGELYRELYQLKQRGADEAAMRDQYREAQRLNIPDRYIDKFAPEGRRSR
jgi:hypothetical protein